MKPIKFKESNICIGENQPDYLPLPAFLDNEDVHVPMTMCFELSDEEKRQVAETGQIWITILTFGSPFHPIMDSVIKPENFE